MSTTKSSPPPKTTERSERPIDLSTPKVNGIGNMEKRWTFHPYRFQKDDDIVCLSREKKPEEEYSAASPSYTPCSPTYPPSSPSLPDLFRNTPPLATPTPDVRASFPNYNLIKTYFHQTSSNTYRKMILGWGSPSISHTKWGTAK
ncbi:hypothetical protein TNCT_228771 [Trichonephila clavata]|uniref:Uncharacterized protein n=1 Tax=Trichonephila clavata TaxID=2740835 RepID=A0A8X6GI41_TRICU|nr:hypothetical protein TNCT_228771 [Trichonephila clavata]